MNGKGIERVTEHSVAALSVRRDTVVWDRALTGFGVRVYPSGAKVYVVQTRGPEGTRRITVGRHGVIGASEARRRATLIIARIRAKESLRTYALPFRPAASAQMRTGRSYECREGVQRSDGDGGPVPR